MNQNKYEILAPAGNMEALIAALRSGADAVYVGGQKYSARNNAVNFTDEELVEAVKKSHLYGAKLYLTVNTILSDDEIVEFCEYIKYTAEIGIDAYIVQDLGAAALIRKCIPDAVLHASTQMTVATSYGARLLKTLGYSRVVPARELDKNTLKKICDTEIETEIFVHGALCMSVSGQCYMSAMIGSRSANRGCCGQACRLPFSAVGNKSCSALSLKDLSLIPDVSQLEEIGADSLKIEGRMKRPEYVAATVNALSEAATGTKPDMQLLKSIFSRGGFTDGYFTGVRSDMFGIREKEDVVSAQTVIPKIHEIYRGERKVHTISFHAVIKNNIPITITASCGNISVSTDAPPPEKAINAPTDLNKLEKQLSKLGDTVFNFGGVTAEIDDDIIVSAGKLNELRRTLTGKMYELIISENTPRYSITDYTPTLPNKKNIGSSVIPIRSYCITAEQAEAAVDFSEYLIIQSDSLLDGKFDNISCKEKIIISPPRFIADEADTFNKLKQLRQIGYSHILCHTPDCIEIGKQLGFTLHGGFGLNIYNSFSAEALCNLGFEDFTVSFEAKASQINEIHSDIPFGAILYGRLPLMLTRNCPIKNEIGCSKCQKKLIDRTERIFPINCCKDYTEILNSDVLYMFDKTDSFSSLNFAIVMFSNEDSTAVKRVMQKIKPIGNITRGLYYRGI